jgi:hypothetical protein
VPDAQGVLRNAQAFAQGQKSYAVQQVCFAFTVVSDDAIQPGREIQFRLGNVLVIEYGQMFQYHITCKIM